MSWRFGWLVLVIAACDSSQPSNKPSNRTSDQPAQTQSQRDTGETASEPAPALPGTLWFLDGSSLRRVANGKRTSITSSQLFPSRWSLPDGRLIAIASRGDGGPQSEQLALVSADRQVTPWGPAASQVRDPVVDPAGKWIVIAMNRDGHSDLYRLELPSGAATRLTNDPQGNFTPALLGGPAGTPTLVFASSRDGDSEIYRMPAMPLDGGGDKATRLTAFYKDDFAPISAPDGKTIVFSSDREGPVRLFAMAPDGTHQHRLTARGGGDGDEVEAIWSRDGKQLAYVVEHGTSRTLWVRELATGHERALTPPDVADAEPSFSPEGSAIAVARTRGGETAVWAIPLGAGDPVRVGSGRLPRWQ